MTSKPGCRPNPCERAAPTSATTVASRNRNCSPGARAAPRGDAAALVDVYMGVPLQHDPRDIPHAELAYEAGYLGRHRREDDLARSHDPLPRLLRCCLECRQIGRRIAVGPGQRPRDVEHAFEAGGPAPEVLGIGGGAGDRGGLESLASFQQLHPEAFKRVQRPRGCPGGVRPSGV